MKFIVILASVCALFSGVLCYACARPSVDYEKLADKITAKTAKKLEQEKGLILIGTGGRMMDDIKLMMMGFRYRKIIDINEARNLLVYCVEEYLTAINNNEKIRPYLHDYPFTAKNIQIEIFICNPDGSHVAPNELNVAAANEGTAVYEIAAPKRPITITACKETYEEALEIVASQKKKEQK